MKKMELCRNVEEEEVVWGLGQGEVVLVLGGETQARVNREPTNSRNQQHLLSNRS